MNLVIKSAQILLENPIYTIKNTFQRKYVGFGSTATFKYQKQTTSFLFGFYPDQLDATLAREVNGLMKASGLVANAVCG